ncbi:hypothetical protein BGZ89_009389 [Linnemannia elongata]|nr:hypothetical protein BGZ89_009389 [Linnemannia elongata]
MINDDHDILSSSGNPVHLSEGSNPAHHQATSTSSSPSPSLSQLFSQLDPTALQVLAAAISPHLPQQPTPAPVQDPSPEPDPYLVSPDQTKTLQLYDRLVELCPSLKISNLHNAQLDEEEAEYIDIKRFSKTANVDYTPPPLPTNYEIKDYVKRQDKEWVTFASKVAQLTRPIDATMHALVRSSNPDDDAIISNVLETLNILRLNIASICSEVTKVRSDRFYRSQHLIPPVDTNKQILVTPDQLAEVQKQTEAYRKAANHLRNRGRGGNYSRFNRNNRGYGNQHQQQSSNNNTGTNNNGNNNGNTSNGNNNGINNPNSNGSFNGNSNGNHNNQGNFQGFRGASSRRGNRGGHRDQSQ